MVHVWESRAALGSACCPPEVVDGQGIDPHLDEAQGELLVERIEPTNIRQDHHPGSDRICGARPHRGEPVAVGAGEDAILVVESTANDRLDRRVAVEVETHPRDSQQPRT